MKKTKQKQEQNRRRNNKSVFGFIFSQSKKTEILSSLVFFVSSERAINAIGGDRHRPLTNPRKICEKKLSQLFQKVSSIRWNERRKTKRKCSRVNPPIGDASANEKRPRRRRYELRLRLVEGS